MCVNTSILKKVEPLWKKKILINFPNYPIAPSVELQIKQQTSQIEHFVLHFFYK